MQPLLCFLFVFDMSVIVKPTDLSVFETVAKGLHYAKGHDLFTHFLCRFWQLFEDER